jgi:hypothetical protein
LCPALEEGSCVKVANVGRGWDGDRGKKKKGGIGGKMVGGGGGNWLGERWRYKWGN